MNHKATVTPTHATPHAQPPAHSRWRPPGSLATAVRGALLALALAGLAAVGTGCNEDAPPPYDRDRVQLLDELFEATRAEDLAQAKRKLDRLRDLEPESISLPILLQENAEGRALVDINSALAKQDLTAATTAYRDHAGEVGPTLRMHAAKRRLDSLVTIQAYLASQPFAKAEQASRAVALLPEQLDSTPESQARYTAWHTAQVAAAEALRIQELRRLQAEQLAELDVALLVNPPAADLIAAQLAFGDPTNPVHGRWPLWLAGRIGEADVRAIQDPLARDLALAMLDHQDPKAARRLAAGSPPVSYAGRALRIRWQLADGDALAGLVDLRALHVALPDAPLGGQRQAFTHRLEPQADAQWTPTLTQALQALYRLQTPPTP